MSLSGFSVTHLIGGLYQESAFEKLTIGNTVKTLTESVFTKEGKVAKRAFITVENASFRFKFHGGTPTASEGHIARPNGTLTIIGTANIKNFKAIRTGNDSTTQITYGF